MILPSKTMGNLRSEFARMRSQFASSLSVSNFATKSNGFAHGSQSAKVFNQIGLETFTG